MAILDAATQPVSKKPVVISTMSKSARTGMKVMSQSLIMLHVWAITRGSQSALAQATDVTTGSTSSSAPATPSMTDAVGAVTEAARDDTLISKVLWYTAVGLLIYVSVGSVILSIDRFIVNRNEKESRKLIRAWMEGDPVPSNIFLDELKKRTTPGPPKDLPYEPYTELDKDIKRKPPPVTVTGNREERRVAKRDKRKEAKKVNRKTEKARGETEDDKSSGNRAMRRENKKNK